MSLLLLLSGVLLWEHVTATSYDKMSNEELYDNLLSTANRTHIVAQKMYKILDLRIAKRRWFKNKRSETCQTTSTPTSNNTKELLNVIINISSAWKHPLRLLPLAVLTHLESYHGMLARAVEVNYRNKKVLEGAKLLLSRIQPEVKENDYPEWQVLRELRSSNETIHLCAFHKLLFCLHKDTGMIFHYFSILRS
ncbi:prolactin-3C1-like [Acomys russatus]|uniref:prolactin-3C1-like n=1 Tax=Acomys russatus TaxID=60746 RepID=UPI0021E30FF3|nr:prolactin-3C1-like [Acomys russatus]